MDRSKTLDWLLVTLLLGLAGLFLSGLIAVDFLTDDFHMVRFVTYGPESTASFDPEDSTEVLRYFAMRATDRFQLYRPLVAVSIRASFDLHGLDPVGYHVENLVLHLLGGLLVFGLGRSLVPEGSRLMALAGAALFLLHPLQIQVAAWTAARSDSLAWLLGGAALLWSLRRPGSFLGPMLLLTASLFAKESALAFVPAVLLLELGGPGAAGRSIPRRAVRCLWSLAPALLYLGLRAFVMGGSLAGARYSGRSFGEFLSAEGLANIGVSALTALGSLSSLFVPTDWAPLFLRLLFGAIQLGLILVAFRALRQRQPRLVAPLAVLLVLPFAMAALVSRLDDNFHNSRGCYLSLGALGVLLAAIRPGRGVVTALVVLFAGLLPISHRVADYYVFASGRSAAMLDELRAELAPLEGGRHEEVALLNFQEESWFRGGLVFSGAIDPALMRPFCGRDWRLHKVRADRTILGYSALVTMAELFPGPRDDLVLIGMHADLDERRQTFERLYPPERPPEESSTITILEPRNGAALLLDPERPESLVPRYRLRHDLGPEVRHRILLFTRNAACIRTPGIFAGLAESAEGPILDLELPPLPARMARDPEVLGTVLLGIVVTDGEGGFLDCSPLSAIELEGRP